MHISLPTISSVETTNATWPTISSVTFLIGGETLRHSIQVKYVKSFLDLALNLLEWNWFSSVGRCWSSCFFYTQKHNRHQFQWVKFICYYVSTIATKYSSNLKQETIEQSINSSSTRMWMKFSVCNAQRGKLFACWYATQHNPDQKQ
jgi:hypothetical protein